MFDASVTFSYFSYLFSSDYQWTTQWLNSQALWQTKDTAGSDHKSEKTKKEKLLAELI